MWIPPILRSDCESVYDREDTTHSEALGGPYESLPQICILYITTDHFESMKRSSGWGKWSITVNITTAFIFCQYMIAVFFCADFMWSCTCGHIAAQSLLINQQNKCKPVSHKQFIDAFKTLAGMQSVHDLYQKAREAEMLLKKMVVILYSDRKGD